LKEGEEEVQEVNTQGVCNYDMLETLRIMGQNGHTNIPALGDEYPDEEAA
jgi:hypothetical protein